MNNVGFTDLDKLTGSGLSAIFFDFDGVLVDSVDIKAQAFMSLFVDQPETMQQQIADIFYRYTGRSRQEKLLHIFQHVLQQPVTTEEIDQLSAQFKERSMQAVINCEAINGSYQLLNSLPQILKTFVVSGTPEKELQDIITARGLTNHFTEIRGTPTRKEKNIANILQRHDLTAKNCLMIGDGKVDQDAALENGMPFIGVVATGKSSPFNTGTILIKDMTELQQLIINSLAITG